MNAIEWILCFGRNNKNKIIALIIEFIFEDLKQF